MNITNLRFPNTKKKVDLFIKYTNLLFAITLFSSCSLFQTSMTPTEIHNTLPTLTKSQFLNKDDLIKFNCICLTRDRSYNAPIGITVKEDLKNGARGIDEWVLLDKGNAYTLNNYKWLTVGVNPQYGSTVTQLYIEFDTYLCE